MNNKSKIIIYQMLPRLFSNFCTEQHFNGSLEENGVGKMNDISENVLQSIKELGTTHVWYTGVIEHAIKTDYSQYGIKSSNHHVVKGNAGSPYAIRDYYDIDPDIAVNVDDRIREFESLVKRTHDAGMKVIIDFVPNHVAREYHSDVKPSDVSDLGEGDDTGMFFNPQNNFFYITDSKFEPSVDLGIGFTDEYVEFPAKATGNDCYNAHPGVNDWFETAKLNYGIDPWNGNRCFSPIPSTWTKMRNILYYWIDKGVDGFRCDMVHMVPVEFWKWVLNDIKDNHPNVIFIGELYDTNIYRTYLNEAKFDYLYDKVNLYDTLIGVSQHKVSAKDITTCWQKVEDIMPKMLNFLENHDEQRLASRYLLSNGMRGRAALLVSATMSTSPFMLYAGQEVGEKAEGATGFSGNDGRTSIFDYTNIPNLQRWLNNGECNLIHLNNEERKIRSFYKKVLTLCNKEKAIAQGSFFDLMWVNYENLDGDKQYVYLRHYEKETLIIAANFDDKPCSFGINIPQHAFDILGLKSGEYRTTELISQRIRYREISNNAKFPIEIEPFSGVIWKFQEN